jgi:GDPmannose 4,6-dehydratase
MGDLSAFRDEGHSSDYVRAMWMMLNQDYIANKHPEDYIVSTGSGARIEDMLKYVCDLADIDFRKVYELDKRFIRPSDVPLSSGKFK